MSKKGNKKSRKQDPISQIVLLTAILNLIKAIIELFQSFNE